MIAMQHTCQLDGQQGLLLYEEKPWTGNGSEESMIHDHGLRITRDAGCFENTGAHGSFLSERKTSV